MSNGNGKSSPKNILFLSFEACAGDLAWRLKQEGYNVRFYVQSKSDRELYDGFLEKVDEWEPHKDWADLIIIDDVRPVLMRLPLVYFFEKTVIETAVGLGLNVPLDGIPFLFESVG